jgi:hypothetical protein
MTGQSNAIDVVGRRRFLGTAAASSAFAANMTVLNLLKNPVMADEVKRQGKRVILLWLAGGASQLETWDPKTRPTNGRSLPSDRYKCARHSDFRTAAETGRQYAGYGHYSVVEHQNRGPWDRRSRS